MAEKLCERHMHFVSCSLIGDSFFLHNFLDGTLLSMDLQTGQMKYLDAEVDGIKFGSAAGYHLVDKSLYMVQKELKYVMRYDIGEDRAECFDLPCVLYTHTRPNASITVQRAKEIYIFPVFDKTIYVFDLEEKRVVKKYELDIMVTALDAATGELAIKPCQALFCKGVCVEGKVWLIPEAGQELVCWLMAENRQETFMLPKRKFGYCDACWHDGELYLLSSDGTLGAWSPGGGWRDIWGSQGAEWAFKRVAVTDKNIWLLPNADGAIKIYDMEKKTFGPCPVYPDGFAYDRFIPGQSLFYLGYEDEDWYYFSMCAQTHMLWVNKHTGKPHWLKPVPPPIEERLLMMMRHDELIFDDKVPYTLDVWLEAFVKLPFFSKKVIGEDVGRRIYDCIAGGQI